MTTVSLSELIREGKLPALLSFGLAFLCVVLMGCSSISPALLSISNQFATIAELCIGFGTTVSAGHHLIEKWKEGTTNGHAGT